MSILRKIQPLNHSHYNYYAYLCIEIATIPYSWLSILGLTGFDSGMKWYVSTRSLDG